MAPNHHRPIGHTECLVDDAAETVTVSETLIQPLRQVTGFEGNGYGLRHHVGHVSLPFGCIEVAVGRRASLQWGG